MPELNQIFTFPQIVQEIKKLEYKTVWLEDLQGLQLLGRNGPKLEAVAHLEKMKGLLESRSMPDGLYKIRALPSNRSVQEPLTFLYQKGRNTPMLSQGGSYEPAWTSKEFGPKEIMNMVAENASLTAQVDSLKKQLASVEMKVQDLEGVNEELRKQNNTLSEGPKQSMMEGLVQLAPAIAPIMSELRQFLRPDPPKQQIQQPAQPGQPKADLATVLKSIMEEQKAQREAIVQITNAVNSMMDEGDEDEEDEPTAQDLVEGLQSGEYTEEDIEQYLSENPEIREEYESIKSQYAA